MKASAIAPPASAPRASRRHLLPWLLLLTASLAVGLGWWLRGAGGGPAVRLALTRVETTFEGIDSVRLRFGTDHPAAATLELSGPGGKRTVVVSDEPRLVHEVVVHSLAPGDDFPVVEAVLTADGHAERCRLPGITGCLGLVRRFEAEVGEADPRALAERMEALLAAGDAPGFATEVAALRRSRMAATLEDVRSLAAAFFAAANVPFDAKHDLYRRLEELRSIDSVAHEYRVAPPLAVAGCVEPWIRVDASGESPSGAVLWDGFSRPMVLRLLDARTSNPRMLDSMAVAWYYHGQPQVGELRFQGQVDPAELARARAVRFTVWPLWTNPVDEVRLAVNGREVSFRTDATVGRGRDLTQDEVGVVLRERRPGPHSYPLVATLPAGYVMAGTNDFRVTYRTACSFEDLRYYMILDVRLGFVEP